MAAALRRDGLYRDGALGVHNVEPGEFRVSESIDQLPAVQFDGIFVCVKSFDSATVATDLADRPNLFHDGTTIVLCQNGWGNAEVFSRYLPIDRILNARIITGFDRIATNRVRVTVHAQPVRIGSLFTHCTGPAEAMATVLVSGGLPAATTSGSSATCGRKCVSTARSTRWERSSAFAWAN